MYLLRPRAWKRARRISKALLSYPIFDLPHRQNPAFLSFEAAKENKQFFLDHRAERIDALRGLLRSFDVELELESSGLAAVSAWFPDYAGLLVKELGSKTMRQAFFGMKMPWTGRLRGLNALFDLGLFFGECIITKNPRCRWTGFYSSAPGEPPRPEGDIRGTGIKIEGSYLKPIFDPFELIYTTCINLEHIDNMFGGPRFADIRPGYLAHQVDVYGTTERIRGRRL